MATGCGGRIKASCCGMGCGCCGGLGISCSCIAACCNAIACCCSAVCCWLSALCRPCQWPSASTTCLKSSGCTGPCCTGGGCCCCCCARGGSGGGLGCGLVFPLGAVSSGGCLAMGAAATATAPVVFCGAVRKPRASASGTGGARFFMGTHCGCWPWAPCHCQTSPSCWHTANWRLQSNEPRALPHLPSPP